MLGFSESPLMFPLSKSQRNVDDSLCKIVNEFGIFHVGDAKTSNGVSGFTPVDATQTDCTRVQE